MLVFQMPELKGQALESDFDRPDFVYHVDSCQSTVTERSEVFWESAPGSKFGPRGRS